MIAPLLVLGALTAAAQTKVGVIHIQNALVGTKDGQAAAKKLEAERAPKTKELEKKQAEIRSLQESLNRGGNAMAEGAKSELMRNIDAKTKSFNRELEDAQAEWDQEQNKILQDLGQKMMAVIDKYAKDNSYSLIIDVSNPQTPVLFASNTIDITKDIIDLYDKNAGTLPAAAPAKPLGTPATKPPAPPATKK